MSKIPECLCSEDDLTACDWQMDITITVQRADTESQYSSVTTHSQRGLNIIQAGVMPARVIDGINEAMVDELAAELTACFGEDSGMAASLSAMRK